MPDDKVSDMLVHFAINYIIRSLWTITFRKDNTFQRFKFVCTFDGSLYIVYIFKEIIQCVFIVRLYAESVNFIFGPHFFELRMYVFSTRYSMSSMYILLNLGDNGCDSIVI